MSDFTRAAGRTFEHALWAAYADGQRNGRSWSGFAIDSDAITSAKPPNWPAFKLHLAGILTLRLAEDGFATFPCNRSKAPACPHGFLDASIDAAVIRNLWQRHQGELVGIATGTVSNLAVLDIDAKHAEARAWWDGHRTQLPPTRTIRTRSGGLHLWYRHVPGLRCSASLIAPGVDVRATGGYVIAWHVAGLPLLRETSLPPWPDWFEAGTVSGRPTRFGAAACA